ncbi:MAG: hypothetical protein IJF92_00140 [Bacilli bacterium]|nr:hypothetical protein [Bacilli bacterium]MBQ3307601.1 hypothetical protein [Bacilli bacterium]
MENRDNIVDFNKAKEEKDRVEANVTEVKAQIEQNEFLKYAIRIISNTAIDNDKLNEASLLEEYKAVTLAKGDKFQSLGQITDSQVGFYYQLLQTGYRTFGANFFKMMCMNETNCIQLFIGVWALINGLETLSEGTASLENELRAYKTLSLTDEQKEKLAEELKKTPQEYIEELMAQQGITMDEKTGELKHEEKKED